MADVHSKETRSYNMSRIKAENTKPEITVRKYLHSRGLRYSLNVKRLPGKPDLYFAKYKTAVEVRGCFWHGHSGCEFFRLPGSKTEWWGEKIAKTKLRDLENLQKLEDMGITTIVVWECELKGDKREETLKWLAEEIKK